MTSPLQAPLETLALASLREDPEVRALLQDGYDAYLNLQSAASLARTPERFLDQTFAWDDWDHTLRACVRRLGPALLRACIERAASANAAQPAEPAPIQPQAAPSVAPQEPQAAQAEAAPAPTKPATLSEPAPSAEAAPRFWIVSGTEAAPAAPQVGAEPRAASVKVTPQAIQSLKDKFRSGSLAGVPSEPQEKSAARRAVREAQALLDKPNPQTMLVVLERWCDMDELRGTALWGQEQMHAWLEALAAMTQFVRAEEPELAKGVKVWANLNSIQQKHRVPYLHGLSKKHAPRFGGWLDDAQERLEDLRVLVGGVALEGPRAEMGASEAQREVEALLERWKESKGDPSRPAVDLSREMVALLGRGLKPNACILRWLSAWEDELVGSELSSLRVKIRKQRKNDEEEEEQIVDHIPSEWPYWCLVRGRVAVVIGSDGKATHINAIQRAFEFKVVEHVPARDGERQAQALASSIRDEDPRVFLMMHRHMSHKLSDRIWENRGRACIYGVETGFGVTAVRLAIEKHGPAYLKRLEEQES